MHWMVMIIIRWISESNLHNFIPQKWERGGILLHLHMHVWYLFYTSQTFLYFTLPFLTCKRAQNNTLRLLKLLLCILWSSSPSSSFCSSGSFRLHPPFFTCTSSKQLNVRWKLFINNWKPDILLWGKILS